MSLEERVIATVAANLEKKYEITPESRLREDLGVDSFNTIMILAGLEDEFSIALEESDFSGIETISDIVTRLKENYPEIAGG